MGMFRSIRRRRILKEHLLPADTWRWLVEDHPILAGLRKEELTALRELTSIFLREKRFSTVRDFQLEDWMCAIISVQACLPILNLGMDWYRNWKSTTVFPDTLVIEAGDDLGEWEEEEEGESKTLGHVYLSWKAVGEAGWGDGDNVVIHEAAHRIDLLDGDVDGRPPLHPGMNPDEWKRVFTTAFNDLRTRLSRKRPRTRVNPDAGQDDGEFFAYTSETFFERPYDLAREYPDVYRLLAAFYRQDPGRRIHAP
jgi:MtfA peptidase